MENGKFELQPHRQPCEPGHDEEMLYGGHPQYLDKLYGPLSVHTGDGSTLAEAACDSEMPPESERTGQ